MGQGHPDDSVQICIVAWDLRVKQQVGARTFIATQSDTYSV